MQRRISGFHQDIEGHWVAELVCGHTQHVRHEPPLQTRHWVLAATTRSVHLGTSLNCLLCDAPAKPPAPGEYEDARLCGLCEDGADEVARRRDDDSPAGGEEG